MLGLYLMIGTRDVTTWPDIHSTRIMSYLQDNVISHINFVLLTISDIV